MIKRANDRLPNRQSKPDRASAGDGPVKRRAATRCSPIVSRPSLVFRLVQLLVQSLQTSGTLSRLNHSHVERVPYPILMRGYVGRRRWPA